MKYFDKDKQKMKKKFDSLLQIPKASSIFCLALIFLPQIED